MDYHAHVYWRNEAEREQAAAMRAHFVAHGYEVGSMHDQPIGPHPLPSFQIIYDSGNQAQVESHLETLRNHLSVLLHEAINDDVRDHTEGARWLGQELALDLEWLDNYTRRKQYA